MDFISLGVILLNNLSFPLMREQFMRVCFSESTINNKKEERGAQSTI